MSGIYAYDLIVPSLNPLTAPRTCPACNEAMASFAASFAPFRNRTTQPDPHAECRKRLEAKRAAAAEALLIEALTAWQRARDQHAYSPILSAVLDLHQPVGADLGPGCAECEQGDGMESTRNVPWPCPTYLAITTVPETDGCNQSAEAEPEAPAPVTINITVQGSVTAERDLVVAVRDALRRSFL